MSEKQHDITKTMLNTIRDVQAKQLNEYANEANVQDSQEVQDNSTTEDNGQALEGQEINGEKKQFMDIVSPRVEFGEFKIYPDANNVVFNGKFDNSIEWQLSKADGLYVNMPNMELTNEILELLKKLSGYYLNWSDEWSTKLNTEYKGGDSEL
jgi:hypothetical protein